MRKYTNEYFREAICCKIQDLNLIAQKADHYLPYLGTVHYLWQGVAPKRNVFRGKNFADPTIKKVKNLITQPQISIKK